MTTARRTIVANLSLSLSLIACSAGAAGAQTRVVPGAATLTPGTFVVSGVAVAVDEGRITVPADRRSGTTATLSLAFVRFRSTSPAPRPPIVFLAGGPGDAATRAFRGMPLDVLDRLRSIADVVAFDQRGTGLSEPRSPTCPPGAMLPRDRPADPRAMLAELRARVAVCLTTASAAGIDVRGLTTAESADDLEALRRALGAERLTLLAGSYGTHLALATARRHPTSVARMALLGVEGPDDTFKLPARVDGVLAVIARARRPTLVDEVRALTARLDSAPARFVFPGGQAIVLGAWDLQRWIAESLDTRQEIDAMLAALPAVRDGDYTALARWALRARTPRPLNLMHLATDCASYASPGRLAAIARESAAAALGDAINFPLPGLCAVPGLPRLDDAYRAPAAIDTPALLVAGTFDGRTPVENARDAARWMRRARTLVVDGASHGLFREPAVLDAVLAFFRE